jgi:hypothetical protein
MSILQPMLNFERPLPKTIKRIIGDKFDTYSPRKGFTDMMLNEGWALEDLSAFLVTPLSRLRGAITKIR